MYKCPDFLVLQKELPLKNGQCCNELNLWFLLKAMKAWLQNSYCILRFNFATLRWTCSRSLKRTKICLLRTLSKLYVYKGFVCFISKPIKLKSLSWVFYHSCCKTMSLITKTAKALKQVRLKTPKNTSTTVLFNFIKFNFMVAFILTFSFHFSNFPRNCKRLCIKKVN